MPVGLGIEFADLTFKYRRSNPLSNDFNASWLPGRTLLLGPNGAGKSTLFRLLVGSLKPQAGEIIVRGSVPNKNVRIWGWLPQQVSSIAEMTVSEQVAFCGWLAGMDLADSWKATPQALERADLMSKAKWKSNALSGGELHRLGLASALVHSPRLLLLDEPTAGLDPMQARRFRELIAELPTEISVISSTHDVYDVSELFYQVMVLDRGSVKFSGTMESFRSLAGSAGDLTRAYTLAIG